MSGRALAIGWLILGVGGWRATAEENLAGRIRNAPLGDAQRQTVLEKFSRHDYAAIETALAVTPEMPPQQSAAILTLLGAIEFVGHRPGPAVDAFERADAIRPLDDKDRFTLAMALANLGRSKDAATHLTLLSELHPNQPLYLYWLARLDYYDRRYDTAVEKLQRVVRLDPGSARAWDNLGLSFDMLGEQAEAEQAFEKAAELNRKLQSPSAWTPHNYGCLLFRMQKFPQAEKSLREALSYDPRFAQAHYYLGRVLEKLGRNEEAIAELKTAAGLDSTLAEPLYSLGLLYRRLGRLDESKLALEQYKKRRPPGQ
jgi:tetratricopeptide (TPR) repeat protein